MKGIIITIMSWLGFLIVSLIVPLVLLVSDMDWVLFPVFYWVTGVALV